MERQALFFSPYDMDFLILKYRCLISRRIYFDYAATRRGKIMVFQYVIGMYTYFVFTVAHPETAFKFNYEIDTFLN